MNLILYEDGFKWDWWLKLVLAFSVLLVLAIAFLAYIDAYQHDVLPSEPEEESKIGAIIAFAGAAFMLLLYWAILPRRLYILEDRVKIKFGMFSLNVPLSNIEAARHSKGMRWVNTGWNADTSLANQIEIIKKKGSSVRVSPRRPDLFLDNLGRALHDWKQNHGG